MSSLINQAIIAAVESGYKVVENNIYKGDKLIKTRLSNWGYPRFNFRLDKKVVSIPAHRFTAYQKYKSEIFKSGIEVRHRNNDKNDFSLDNIILGNHTQNMNDFTSEQKSIISQKHKETKGQKYNEYHADIIKAYDTGAFSNTKLCREFNINPKSLKTIVTKSYTALNLN